MAALIADTTSGARFGTVTANDCDAVRSPGSRAVTVTSAAPADTPVTVTSEPDAVAVATLAADETAAYASASPSGSLKCPEASTATVSPTSTVNAPIAIATAGGRFGGGGSMVESPPSQAERRTNPSPGPAPRSQARTRLATVRG